MNCHYLIGVNGLSQTILDDNFLLKDYLPDGLIVFVEFTRETTAIKPGNYLLRFEHTAKVTTMVFHFLDGIMSNTPTLCFEDPNPNNTGGHPGWSAMNKSEYFQYLA